MSETKQISTLTDVEYRNNGANTTIRTFYRELEPPFTIYAFLSEEVFRLNITDFIEGDLGIRMIYYPERIDYSINSNGELIVIGENANNYYINADGELIYNDGIVSNNPYVLEGGEDTDSLGSPDIVDGGEDSDLEIDLNIIDGGIIL